MNKKIFIFILSIILILNATLSKNVYAEEKKDTITVGVFNLEPYAYLNSHGEIDGYYIELFDLIANKMNVEVKYVLNDLKAWSLGLENGQVDIILGSSIIEERAEKLSYSKYSIALERFALYTNKDIDPTNLQSLDTLTIGGIKQSTKIQWILNLFKSLNIEFTPILVNTNSELYELMDNKKIDLMVDSADTFNNYKKIYEFIGDKTYIAAKKENQALIDKIDNTITGCYSENEKFMKNIYNKYFEREKNKIDKEIIILVILSIGLIVIYIAPQLRKKFIRKKINNRLNNDRYLLYYQPIYDPMKEIIVGFEGLLRLKDKNDKLISPGEFIPEIEKNNMLFDVTLWIIKQVISDYKEIKNYNCVSNNNFYISINLSIDEIKNNEFVDKAIKLLEQSNLEKNSICLEILERVKINDIDKIIDNIAKLKLAGFKIAIDDFGAEYSNLDILQKLDADIIKVDKNFVDGLGKHLVKSETILFILRVAEKEKKSVVLEGIEEKEQHYLIKGFDKKNVFVQGYFYNKPMEKEKIKSL